MTKYECSRILGIRSVQISMCAPIMLDYSVENMNPLKIAALEMKEKKLDVVIRRPLPNNNSYEINIKNLKIPSEVQSIIDSV